MFTAMHEAQMHMILWLSIAGVLGAMIIWMFER